MTRTRQTGRRHGSTSVLFQEILRNSVPDLVLTYGYHPVLIGALHAARARAAPRPVRTVRAYGYEHRAWFDDTDRVLTNSRVCRTALSGTHRAHSTALPSPIVWSEVPRPR